MNKQKRVKAWAVFNGGGHILEWTVRSTRRAAINKNVAFMNEGTWADIRRRFNLTVRRVTVEWEEK